MASQPPRTTCRAGHRYTTESTGITAAGRRYCKTCARESNRANTERAAQPVGKDAVNAAYAEVVDAYLAEHGHRSETVGLRFLRPGQGS